MRGDIPKSNKKTALLMIDMQRAFIDSDSILCIAGARATVDACAKVLQAARGSRMPIYHIRREYSFDGSDVEPVRYGIWVQGGKPLCKEGSFPDSVKPPDELVELPGETIIVKPRFSAFFGTGLDGLLRQRGIGHVVLMGTTTPNCIRATCYDALSLNFDVTVIEDAASSRTPEVQRANIDDMAYIGANIVSSDEFLTVWDKAKVCMPVDL